MGEVNQDKKRILKNGRKVHQAVRETAGGKKTPTERRSRTHKCAAAPAHMRNDVTGQPILSNTE